MRHVLLSPKSTRVDGWGGGGNSKVISRKLLKILIIFFPLSFVSHVYYLQPSPSPPLSLLPLSPRPEYLEYHKLILVSKQGRNN